MGVIKKLTSEKTKKAKRTKTHKTRHKVFYWLLRPLVQLFVKLKFGFKFKKVKNKDLPKNYIVISNHVTDYDALFVACSFRKQMYFVASEHITRWKTAYRFLKFVFDPIIRYKASPATSTIMEMLRKVRGGENICIFAEGVRSWTGETHEISYSTAKMIKSAKCGLVTYKISGGYLSSPIWAESGIRKGYIKGEVAHIYTAEDIEKMTTDEVYSAIINDVYENAFATQELLHKKYKGKHLAEGIENLISICENCGAHDSITSKGDMFGCSACGKTYKYNEYGVLEDCRFKNVLEYSAWQLEKIKDDVKSGVSYVAEYSLISKLNLDHSKEEIATGRLEFNNKTLTCGEFKINTKDVTDVAVFGKHGLVLMAGKDYYEILPDRKFSTYKFWQYFKMYKKLNEDKEEK